MLRHYTILLALVIFSCLSVLAQKKSLNIATELNGKVGPYLEQEKQLGSTLFLGKADKEHKPGLAKPITYRRAQAKIPDLLVTYTFAEKDSVLKGIDYEWNPLYFDSLRRDMPLKDKKIMIKKYDELMLTFFKKLGTRDELGWLGDLSILSATGGISQRDKWVYQDTTDIYLVARFINKTVSPDGDTVRPLNLIRLSLKRIPKIPPLTLNELEIPRQRFASFIAKVREEDIEGAKAFLSKKLAATFTKTAFARFKANLKPETLVTTSGRIEAIDGNVLLVVNYVYDNETQFPNTIYRVVYDADHRINEVIPLVWKITKKR